MPVLAASLAVVLSASAPPVVTDAAWQDPDLATGSFAALTVPAPTLNGQCRYDANILGLGAYVRILWKPPAGYDITSAELLASTSGLGSLLAPLTGFSLTAKTTGSPATGYVTDVPVNLLGGLLGLGSELELAIVTKHDGWTSRSAAVATNAGLIVGLGANCRNLPPVA
ncbi:hypothetical protein [Arthrobacter sp. 9AX]|uniref:hypothetical protein n=1 Tax=Arthrobacter sp. 9AX TaxID=2653131 RepID=UPI00135B347F|nr:hypothetical protein [Arthrobacter sp. 9AX]